MREVSSIDVDVIVTILFTMDERRRSDMGFEELGIYVEVEMRGREGRWSEEEIDQPSTKPKDENFDASRPGTGAVSLRNERLTRVCSLSNSILSLASGRERCEQDTIWGC